LESIRIPALDNVLDRVLGQCPWTMFLDNVIMSPRGREHSASSHSIGAIARCDGARIETDDR
jgi:hypothetical protein